MTLVGRGHEEEFEASRNFRVGRNAVTCQDGIRVKNERIVKRLNKKRVGNYVAILSRHSLDMTQL